MVPLTVHRLREWPRLLAGGVVVAIVLFGLGLLVGTTVGSTHTTDVRTHTLTATVTVESPAQAAQIQADGSTIAALNSQLAASRQQLTRAEGALRAALRRARRQRTPTPHRKSRK